jgi:hypothetical protein
MRARIFDDVGISPDAPLVVDVSGGFGYNLRILKDKLPSGAYGELILQDQSH